MRRRRRGGPGQSEPHPGAAYRGVPPATTAGCVLNQRLQATLAVLDTYIDHEKWGAGVSAGRVDGLSLEPMNELMSIIGDPHHAYPVIHITGTNGKGSVARMISSLLMAAGLVVGTYTSPHLIDINERISRNLEPIDDDEFDEALTLVLATEPLWSQPPSWFELVTATAFDWFATSAVDVAVVEVGLLGRFDATNVVDADVAVITNIGMDHTDGQPGWEARVTAEKAGIVTPGRDVVVGPMKPELRDIVAAEGPERMFAASVDYGVLESNLALGGHLASITTPYGVHTDVMIPVHGAGQVVNAAIALCAVETFFDRALGDDVVEEAFASLTLPGRAEVVCHQPLVIFDSAHNVDAAEALATTLEDEFTPIGSRILVLGVLAGRRPAELVSAFAAARFDTIVCTTPPSPRALPANELAVAARAAGYEPEVIDDPEQAIASVLRYVGDDDLVVVAGSFYLAPPARAAFAAALRSP